MNFIRNFKKLRFLKKNNEFREELQLQAVKDIKFLRNLKMLAKNKLL